MAVTICHSSIDERGKASGGSSGDQTGREVCTRVWYDKGWNIYIEYPDAKIMAKAAAIAKKLADSGLVGYDQNQRNTLYQQLKKCGWDVDKYIKSGVKTECDCSSFIYAVYCCLIAGMRSDSNAPTTSTMRAMYKKWGFTVYTAKKYLTSDKYLKTGGILVKESSHTVMAITNGSGVSNPVSVPTAEVKTDNSIKGKVYKVVTNTDPLNIRSIPSTSGSKLGKIPKGDKVTATGEVSNGWYKITYKGITGWVSGEWIKAVSTKTISKGDTVKFTGTIHYNNASATATGYGCKGGKAKVTNIKAGAAHPYHLQAVVGAGSTVYGWVNAVDVKSI